MKSNGLLLHHSQRGKTAFMKGLQVFKKDLRPIIGKRLQTDEEHKLIDDVAQPLRSIDFLLPQAHLFVPAENDTSSEGHLYPPPDEQSLYRITSSHKTRSKTSSGGDGCENTLKFYENDENDSFRTKIASSKTTKGEGTSFNRQEETP